jgi:hypothetical protein
MITVAEAWHIFIGGMLGGFVLGALLSIAVYHGALAKAERAYDAVVDKYNELVKTIATPAALLFKCNSCDFITAERRVIHDHAAVLGHHGWSRMKPTSTIQGG